MRRLLPTALLVLLFFFPRGSRAELPPPRPEPTPPNSIVYFASDQNAVGPKMTPRYPMVSRMVAGLVCAVTGRPTSGEAWRTLVKPGDRVGRAAEA